MVDTDCLSRNNLSTSWEGCLQRAFSCLLLQGLRQLQKAASPKLTLCPRRWHLMTDRHTGVRAWPLQSTPDYSDRPQLPSSVEVLVRSTSQVSFSLCPLLLCFSPLHRCWSKAHCLINILSHSTPSQSLLPRECNRDRAKFNTMDAIYQVRVLESKC